MSIYEKIGPVKLEAIIEDFYGEVFSDPMLSHFFFNLDLHHLIKMQVAFVTSMLGGPQAYKGQSLAKAHDKLNLRPPHFLRRQKILKEAMLRQQLPEQLAEQWLRQEERLKPLLLGDLASCHEHPSRKN